MVSPMPNYPHIERYREHLNVLREFGGHSELNLSIAFQNCLDSYCRDHRERLVLVPQLSTPSGLRPDGTVKDSLRMARGFWEAKDSDDDLETEIQKKFDKGYPRDNIVFEDTETAVLVQNGAVAMRVDMRRPDELQRLIRHFLDYELPQIEEFRKARQQFKEDLPTVLGNLRETIVEAEANNANYRLAAAEFLDLCRHTIGPDVSGDDVREMLLQHILTKDIFLSVFSDTQFHSENNVARQLDSLEQTFFTGSVKRDAIDRLRAYYGAIGRAAYEMAEYSEKQKFIKAVYEDFYKVYNPKAADKLGVVYTPNEVVDFMIRGTDHLLRKHFGRGLADENVQILDPATGTGTFITNLINYLPEDRLEYKYLNEIHANEVAILPYYIANLNIEYTYKERTGRYLGFPNLCFVDTLDNMGWQEVGATGGAVQRQGALNLGGLSVENWMRVQEQNEKTISVIIGNPPYNANQVSWNDFNPNREYPAIDRRIKETYVSASSAQKTKQYDMYKRFIRWASDRLADDGIIAFVTNRAYLEARQDDGFRKVAGSEFTDLYVLDLGSDVIKNPKISGTTHNVFGIKAGVAIGFFVRDSSNTDECSIHYARREDAELAIDKLAFLDDAELPAISFEGIVSDVKNYWLNQSDTDFDSLIPLANRQTKHAQTANHDQAIFRLHTLGVSTNRDSWVYDFDLQSLRNKGRFFADTYNGFIDRKEGSDDTVIKWSRDLRNEFRRGRRINYTDEDYVQSLYRPFTTKWHFTNFVANDVLTKNHYEIFGEDLRQENQVICFLGSGARRPFAALATNKLPSLALFIDGTQCLPLYRFVEGAERTTNLTEWGLHRFRVHYGDESISAEDIFAYIYAVLHDSDYRGKYAVDLLREFPRIPLYSDFRAWAGIGQTLLDLHIGFESVEPYALSRDDTNSAPGKPSLKADKDSGIIAVDKRTRLTGVPTIAWEYRLGNRSALEWVLDQYKERKPKDPTIAERFNTYRFADYKDRVIDLLGRVCTVSVRTMELIDSMPNRSCSTPVKS